MICKQGQRLHDNLDLPQFATIIKANIVQLGEKMCFFYEFEAVLQVSFTFDVLVRVAVVDWLSVYY